ncbi:MAG TPA: hypothetical protein VFO10_28920 [Oligoflexus sp.]|uniref:hypothetical protein n=1 Tax=Oligoflexus sp. TaxID=1971216 RepID=UPI002D7E6A3F|nr:hypothetical protein [Oligoflexus sp.]HET9241323.1 hypothetical protein [Oligoflexus sp.]
MRRAPLSALLMVGLLFNACAEEAPKVSRSQPTTAVGPGQQGNVTPGTSADGKPSPGTPGTGATPATPVDGTIPAGPTTTAVTVAAGTMSFDLASAKPALTGASFTTNLTVNAAAGAAPASITFSNMAVKTPANTGFVLYRPVLVLMDGGKETQYPIGQNINLKIPKGRTVPLAGLTTISFENISAGASIKLRFSALEPLADALLDGIPNYRECKSPQNFQNVATALQSCKSCHSGLFAYEFMDKDIATACGQNLKIIDPSLNGGIRPNIPAGAHQGTNAGPVNTAIGPWRTGEGL